MTDLQAHLLTLTAAYLLLMMAIAAPMLDMVKHHQMDLGLTSYRKSALREIAKLKLTYLGIAIVIGVSFYTDWVFPDVYYFSESGAYLNVHIPKFERVSK